MKTAALYNIINFVNLSERIDNSSENLIEFLNKHYFSIIHGQIVATCGSISDIIGDRQYAYWDIKNDDRKKINNIIESAKNIIELSKKQNEKISFPFEIIISIATSNDIYQSSNKCMILNGVAKNYQQSIIIDDVTKNITDINLTQLNIDDRFSNKYNLKFFKL